MRESRRPVAQFVSKRDKGVANPETTFRMNITSGLMDHAVLQRNTRGVNLTTVTGEVTIDGHIRVSVRKRSKFLPGLKNKILGKTTRKHFSLTLSGIPTGGPYDLTLQLTTQNGHVSAEQTFTDILVGDVWILGGQSNMQGCALLQGSPKAIPFVRAFYMDDSWAPAQDPIHNMWNTVDDVHLTVGGGRPGINTVTGTGPGVSFGQALYMATGVPQGVIACAHGGTAMSQWNPAMKNQGTKSLYGAMLRRFVRNGSNIAGVVWYQGESDANPDACRIFTTVMKDFIKHIRRDMGNPSLPFISVQISRVVGWGTDSTWWNSIQDQQRILAESIPHYAIVPAIDLPLVDPIHISTEGHITLGRRLAEAALTLSENSRPLLPAPLALKHIRAIDGQLGSAGCVEVTFANVVGELTSKGRPSGFSVFDEAGMDVAYRTRLDGDNVIIDTGLGKHALNKCRVHYGYGVNPYCNIQDAAGRALPVLGPVHLGSPRPITAMAQFYHVSKILPSAGKLHTLSYPKTMEALEFRRCDAMGNFCRLHESFSAISPRDVHAFLAWNIHCTEPMKLGASLGYDGPVKVWANSRMIFHDPNGTNPATADSHIAEFKAKKGDNELLIALGSNFGSAWGVFLSFERLDISSASLRKQPRSFAMPEIRPYE
jgi:hypothetical protein